jgi:hypothetical protein
LPAGVGGKAAEKVSRCAHALRFNGMLERQAQGCGKVWPVTQYTLVPLRADQEAFLDYGLIIDEADSPADYPCHCGAPGCRGTMVATMPAAEENSPAAAGGTSCTV